MASNRVIATAGIVAVAVGSANSIGKNHKLPSAKFLIGSGVAFLVLSALAEVDLELANALAIAVCVTVVLGEGGGVLSYINHGEMDTAKSKTGTPKTPPTQVAQPASDTSRLDARFYQSSDGLAARPNLATP